MFAFIFSNRIRIFIVALLLALPGPILLPGGARGQQKSPEETDRQVEALLGKLTLEQKIDLIHGTDGMFIPPMPQIGLPSLKMSDGPMGVRSWGPTTGYAIGIGLAASWDTKLAQRVGVSLGHDARARGVNFLLGPGVNIYRAPMNGRNFEYFGEDPYLAGQIAAHYILGVQSQNVVATVKHYDANNSEYDRHGINAIVDERTLRELYLPAFEAAVKEGHVGAVMDSYNLINGEHATQSKYLNTDVLKKDWGFRGILMSDWLATYDGIAAANSGLDLEMPSGEFMNAKTLLPAIQEGKVSAATIDDKVRRILRIAVEYGFLDHEQQDLNIPLFNPQSEQVALESGLENMVLLKNQGALLPLDRSRVHTLAVIGPNAYPAQPTAGGSGNVTAIAPVSFLTGISAAAGTHAKVFWSLGLKDLKELFTGRGFSTDSQGLHLGLKQEEFDSGMLAGQPDRVKVVASINHWTSDDVQPSGKGPAIAVRWTGFYTPSASGPQLFIAADYGGDAGFDTYQLYVGDKLLLKGTPGDGEPQYAEVNLSAGEAVPIRFDYLSKTNMIRAGMGALPAEESLAPGARKIAALADVAVVAVGLDSSTEGEGHDRTFHLPPGQEVLIKAVASANPHTVVVLTGGGAVSTSGWLDRVPVLLDTWYAGSQGGNALAQVLFGRANPGGKLPMSWWNREEDDPTFKSYCTAPGSEDLKYTEGVFVGYRAYGVAGRKPEFPFGFGLSYTTFAFSHLGVTPDTASPDTAITVSFDITNTGHQAGAEVAQVYVSDPSATVARPERELKGFARVELKPGEIRHVTFPLNRRSLAYWDVNSHAWKVDPGKFVVHVGDSADNTPLTREFTVK